MRLRDGAIQTWLISITTYLIHSLIFPFSPLIFSNFHINFLCVPSSKAYIFSCISFLFTLITSLLSLWSFKDRFFHEYLLLSSYSVTHALILVLYIFHFHLLAKVCLPCRPSFCLCNSLGSSLHMLTCTFLK